MLKRWNFLKTGFYEGIKLAGYTQVVWDPENYTVLSQEDTGVVPEHRNRGLGRWLKAAMAEKLLQDLPGAGFILTSNAASNDAMLGINREMGFKLYKTMTTWQIDTDSAADYLANRLTSSTSGGGLRSG